MEYNQIGEINLGVLDSEEQTKLFDKIKELSRNDINAGIKKTNENMYYISIPISVPSGANYKDPFVYVEPTVSEKKYYFDDLTVYDQKDITYIYFDKNQNKFISNIQFNNCSTELINFDPSLFEIIPLDVSGKTLENQIEFTKNHILKKLYYLERLVPYFDLPFLRPLTPSKSYTPRTNLYLIPGKSLTRPPRTKTTACSCKL
jgi:hypothetical protein